MILVDEKTITLLRPGIIEVAAIEEVTKILVTLPIEMTESVLSPGMKYRHYSPNAIIRLFYDKDSLYEAIKENAQNSMLLLPQSMSFSFEHSTDIYIYSEQNLFALFRLADEQHYFEILLFVDEATTKKMGLLNRIKKAASK